MVKNLTVILLLFVATAAYGQSAVKSNDYWVTFLPSIDNVAPAWLLVSASTPNTTVRVAYTDDGSFDEFIVSPGAAKEYRMRSNTVSSVTYQLAKPDQAHVVQRRSAHVTSDHPIALQQFTDGDNNVSMSLPVPTNHLGRKYVISAFRDQDPVLSSGSGSGGWEPAKFPRTSGEFIVVAVEDGTKVTILASAKFKNGLQLGQSETITLNKGQTYLAMGAAENSSNDISNTLVTADKPIAVTAGCEIARTFDALVLENHFDFNDYIAEYMLPVEQWGTEYVGVPLTNKRGTMEDDLWGDFYRVYATEETELFVNGESKGSAKYWEFSLQTVPRLFKADKPIMVVQYDYYIDFHGTNPKSPRTSNSMQVLLPRHQWVKQLSGTLPAGYAQTYFYVAAHRDSIDLIKVKLAGTATPIPISSLKFTGTPVFNVGPYRVYTLILGVRGEYLFESPCQFQVLNHGTRDNDAIKATYSYGSIVGSTFGRMTSSDFASQIDSSCGGFDLTFQDTAVGDGFADVILLSDASRNYVSFNTRLQIDPHSVGAKTITGSVTIDNALLDAYAAVQLRTRAGKEKVIELRYHAPKLTVSESLTFDNVRYGDTLSKNMEITNVSTLPIRIDEVVLYRLEPSFRINTIDPLPHVLSTGDKHKFTVSYSPRDTGAIAWDSIAIVSECIAEPVRRLEGVGRVATIFAEDQDFKRVDVSTKRTEQIQIRNLSPFLELTLTGYQMPDGKFHIDATDSLRFPITLSRSGMPGDRTSIGISYQPAEVGRDTALIIWQTDILPPYNVANRKEWTMLIGEAVTPLGVESERNDNVITLDDVRIFGLHTGEIVRSIHVMDLLGRTLLTSDVQQIDTRALGSGVYLLRVSTNERTLFTKFIR